MKKILSLLLAMIMVFSLAACSGNFVAAPPKQSPMMPPPLPRKKGKRNPEKFTR